MAVRRIYFYRVNITEKGTNNIVTHNAPVIFNDIFQQNSIESKELNSLILHYGEVKNGNTIDRVTMDIIHNDSNYLFARVGKTKDVNEALIRDIRTNQIDNVVDPEETAYKKLEIFTYFLLDYTNGILGFIEGQSAPSVQTLKNIVNNHSDLYEMSIENIVSNETVRALLTPGSIINKISYTFRVPNPEILNGLGLPPKVIDVLTDTDLTQAKLIIRNDSRKYLTSIPSVVGRLITSLGEVSNSKDKDVSITGRTQNSSMQDYSFELQNYSANVDIPTTRIIEGEIIILTLDEIAEEAFTRMRAAYFTNRDNIINLGNVG